MKLIDKLKEKSQAWPDSTGEYLYVSLSDIERVLGECRCMNCKYLNKYLMCENDNMVLNRSNSSIEFLNIAQAKEFSCIHWQSKEE